MAITRAQQAKQMLRKGGRIGLKPGGPPGGGATSMGSGRDYSPPSGPSAGPAGGASAGGNYGGNVNVKQEYGGKTFEDQSYATQRAIDGANKKEEARRFQESLENDRKRRERRKRALEKRKLFQNISLRNKLMLDPTMRTLDDNLIDVGEIGDQFATIGGIPIGFAGAFGKAFKVDPSTKYYDEDSIREIAANLSRTQKGGITATQEKTLDKIRDDINMRDRILDPDDTVTQSEFDEYINRNKIEDIGGEGGIQDPCLGPNPPAYCFIGSRADETKEAAVTRNLSGLTPRIGGSIFDFTGMADGGIADMDREAFLLGGITKGLKKAVRGVKKLAKSPIGKAAIGAALFGGFGGGLKSFLLGAKGPPGIAKTGILQKLFLKNPSLGFSLSNINPITGILGVSTLAGLMTPKQDDDEFDLASYYAQNKLEPSQSIRGMGSEFDFYGGERMRVADGGRIEYDEAGAVMSKEDMEKIAKSPLYKGFKKMYGVDPSMAKDNPAYDEKFKAFEQLFKKGYQEGGDVEPVAKKTMPLLDMDGKEKDYRETGGFVDMGRMERADDVPARLSKNEFVFTADAVRNAGEGDIDKGAEVMYNMMKNLEAGGEVSEESQGLEGARKMFQTSQRLGEVI